MPLDTPLALESFPRIRRTKDGIKVLDHVDNIDHMLESYGLGYRYNVIRKEIEWEHPGLLPGGDNADTALQSQMISLCALNAVPDKHLTMHLVGLADQNATNPVVEHLVSLSPEWDGKPRFGALAAAMQPDDTRIAEIVLRLFLIQACAAADNAALGRAANADALPVFEGCLVLAGGQGVFKTKGVRRLLPPALRGYFKEGLMLDPRNKDSMHRRGDDVDGRAGRAGGARSRRRTSTTSRISSARPSTRYGRRSRRSHRSTGGGPPISARSTISGSWPTRLETAASGR